MKRGDVVVESPFMSKKEENVFKEKPQFQTCYLCSGPVSLEAMFCCCCNALQKPKPNMSHYAILDFSILLYVEESQLEEAYIRRLSLVHPDKFVNASEDEKLNATLWSASINKAYEVFNNPVESLIYWLKIKAPSFNPQKPSITVLEKIMEMEEALSEAEDKEPLKNQLIVAYKKALSLANIAGNKGNYEEGIKFIAEAEYWGKVGKRYDCNFESE